MKNLLITVTLTLFSPILFSSQNLALKQRTILFIGDSLTEGYGVDKDKSYVALIEKDLKGKGMNVKILNGSVSGSTTSSGIKRLRWFLKAKPEILVLALGANDGLRGVKLETSKKNLDDIIELAKRMT